MSIEQLLVFVVLFGLAMLQLLKRALDARHRAGREAELGEAVPGEAVPFSELDWNEEIGSPSPAPPPAAPPVLHTVAAPKPIVPAPPARLPVRTHPEPQPNAYASVGRRGDLLPRNRSELRRAIALMAILNPPRALEPR